MSKYIINARKSVQLVQMEIEAESEQEAARIYLEMAKAGEIEVSDYNWDYLSEGDLEIEQPHWLQDDYSPTLPTAETETTG